MIKAFNTYLKLGISNLVTVLIYRIAIKIGLYKKLCPVHQGSSLDEQNQYFNQVNSQPNVDINVLQYKAFGWQSVSTDRAPNWQASVINQKVVQNNKKHWSTLSDFDLAIGDIKGVWELSRFDWVVIFSVNYIATASNCHIDQLNQWLNDWVKHNPINKGVNWKCGQEASLRVFHLLSAAFLLQQLSVMTPALQNLLTQHLTRIYPTIRYAVAQDNNHGTSEAAALFVGASVLLEQPDIPNKRTLETWQKTGRKWLENRVNKLIDGNGAFSQHSTNYHRLMLDTLTFSEFIKQQLGLPDFTNNYKTKVKSAINWLRSNVINENQSTFLGLNDSAQLLPITTCDRRDLTPSIQWADAIFTNKVTFNKTLPLHQLTALLPPINELKFTTKRVECHLKLQTSYATLSTPLARLFLRTPNTRFRPSACDALHLDLWLFNKNVFCSTGSYSYNCEKNWQEYFKSVKSHNAVQFDSSEQMPKLSRFLYSDWIKTIITEHNTRSLSAQYTNSAKHTHIRHIELFDKKIVIKDTVFGFEKDAILRWHMGQKGWDLSQNRIERNGVTISITSENSSIDTLKLVEGHQSKYYSQKENIQVLAIKIIKPDVVSTVISW